MNLTFHKNAAEVFHKQKSFIILKVGMKMLIEIRNKSLVIRIGLLLAATSICALLFRLLPPLTEYALFGTSILPAIILEAV